jgi:hypothetical protein
MNYDTAKARFETIVTRMQEELKGYANKPRASQAAIDARLENINSLVEYYTLAEQLISEEQMKNMELQVGFTKLHTDTQRLVYWCKLHGINPNAMFQFTQSELEAIYKKGIIFSRNHPLLSFSTIDGLNEIRDKYISANLCSTRRRLYAQ